MSNLINRATYGNFACLWGVFRARFTYPGDRISPHDLKHSDSATINPVDICPGRMPFSPVIAKAVGRSHYCPFLQSRTDARICEWVSSEIHDPQKSKPVGQAAIMLEIMGLCDLKTSSNGTVQEIIWNQRAEQIARLKWGETKLDEYFIHRILGYGPILAIIDYLREWNRNLLLPNDLYDVLKILPSQEKVSVVCEKGTITDVLVWDGNTSNDAAIRSVASLLTLAACTGIVKPVEYPNGRDLTPSAYSDWLNMRAINGKTSFPRKWLIDVKGIKKFSSRKLELISGIGYRNFIPKGTDRNAGSRCRCCDENVINNAKMQFGDRSRNRKLLLIGALIKANEMNSDVNLRRLAEISTRDQPFYISKSTQYDTLVNIEIHNVALFGCVSHLEKGYLTPAANYKISNFAPYPPSIIARINELLSDPTIFRKRK